MTAVLAPVRVTLANGAIVIVQPLPALPLVAVEAYLPAGQAHEAEDQAGVAMLAGRLLCEGTQDLDGLEIARRIEDRGGTLATSATGGALALHARDVELGLALLASCLTAPTFPAPAFERVRARQHAAIVATHDDPARVARLAFDELVYGAHPFHRPATGYADTLARLTPADCAAHHRARAAPSRLVLSIAGDVGVDRAIALADRYLGGPWGAAALPLPAVAPAPPHTPAVHRVPLDVEQCHVVLGHLGIRRADPDYYALEVADQILGSGSGFTDRISAKVRDELGLAYAVHASITAGAGAEPGAFYAYVGTTPEHEALATLAITAEVRRIKDELVGPDELAAAKAFLVGSAAFGYETARQVARYLVDRERLGLGELHRDYPTWIERVSAEDVRRACRAALDPEALAIVVAGPAVGDNANVGAAPARP